VVEVDVGHGHTGQRVGAHAEPVEGVEEAETSPFARNFLMSQEGVDLANLFPRLPQRRVRRRLVELVRSLVEEGEVEPAPAEALAEVDA
jgi:hypothetical protein